jgi:hypothetical protein
MFSLLAAIMKFIFKSITTGSLKFNAYSTKSMKHSVRRLCCYFILMNFRGWVLYLCLNQIEDQFVADFSSVSSKCWYMIEGWFPHNSEEDLCAGRPFDFSDHIVLYYAQILPIALFETLHIGIEYPKWFTVGDPEHAVRQTRSISTMRRYINHSFRRFVSMILFGSHVYLQIITSFGAYKTSVYFHTPFEIIAGFCISMTIAAPLCYLQCSNRNDPSLSYIRSILLES